MVGCSTHARFDHLLQPLASGVAGVKVVPELNVFFVLFPAQEDFLAANDRREIDQPTIDILDLDFSRTELFDRALDIGQEADPWLTVSPPRS